MRRILFILVLIVIGCLFCLTAQAQEKIKPEDEVPGWLTDSPYQRNVYLDFVLDPSTTTGPIRGAIYEGLADEDVYESDQFRYDGNVTVQNGMIGIAGGGSGTIYIHLANLPTANPVKRIYVEGNVRLTDISDALDLENRIFASYGLPINHDVVDSDYGVKDLDIFSLTGKVFFWAEIQPNPEWEEAKLVFQGILGSAWIEDVHIATECVPDSECISDTDSDGVVDGADLAKFIETELYISVAKFAEQFGKIETDC